MTTTSGATGYTQWYSCYDRRQRLTERHVDNTSLACRGEDRDRIRLGRHLTFTTQPGITGNHAPGTGIPSFSGSASVGAYETTLKSVKFSTSNLNPSGAKSVSFKVNDGSADSNIASKSINVAGNDGPVITTTASNLAPHRGRPGDGGRQTG